MSSPVNSAREAAYREVYRLRLGQAVTPLPHQDLYACREFAYIFLHQAEDTVNTLREYIEQVEALLATVEGRSDGYSD